MKRFRNCLGLLLCLLPLMMWHHQIARIPVPEVIQLVPGYLQWDNCPAQMDIETGEIRRRPQPPVVFYKSGKRISFDYIQAFQRLSVTLEKVEAKSPTETPAISAPVHHVIDSFAWPEVLSGRYLIRESGGQLWAWDMELTDIKAVSIAIPTIQNSGANESLFLLEGTNRLVRNNSSSGKNDMTLYQIEPDEIRLIKTWDGAGAISYANDKLYICQTNLKQVDVRSAIDGTLLHSVPLPDTKAITGQPIVKMEQDFLVLYDNAVEHFIAFDLSRQAIVNFPTEGYFPPQLTNRSRYVTQRSKRFGGALELLVYDREKDTVIQKIASPLGVGSSVVYDQRHLLFTSRAHGISAALVDMETGREVKRWVPFAWLSWSTLLFCPLMALWMVAWCLAAAKAHPWPWLDVLLLVGLLALMAAYRIVDGPFQLMASSLLISMLMISVIQCAGWWSLLSRRKLTSSVSLIMFIAAIAQTSFILAMKEPEQRWSWLIAASLCLAFVLGIAHMTRRTGKCLNKAGDSVSRISVFDYMLLTLAMAVGINAIRLTTAMQGAANVDGTFVLHLTLPALLGTLGLAAGFTNRSELFTTALSLAALAIIIIIGAREVELLSGQSPMQIFEGAYYTDQNATAYFDYHVFVIHRVIEAWLVGLAGAFLATIPLRLRGWRSNVAFGSEKDAQVANNV